VSTPRSLVLPDGVRRTVISTGRGAFAALEAFPGTGICERQSALLIPGYTGSKEDFLPVLRQLAAAGRRVLAIDMRGQYETPGSGDPHAYAPAALGMDITAILTEFAASSPRASTGLHLLGHSFGGLVARETMLAGTAGIGSLTLMSSGPARITGQRAAILRWILTTVADLPPPRFRAEIERIWDTQLAPQAAAVGTADEIVAFLRERMLRSSPAGLRSMGEQLLTAPDRTAELASRDDVPILVLYGEDDEAWEPAVQEEMAARLRAERVCIPGAAHAPAVEAPETTASALTAFWNAAEMRQRALFKLASERRSGVVARSAQVRATVTWANYFE
jgi:pimeloyl-ACP methyl ester carboxylesterase